MNLTLPTMVNGQFALRAFLDCLTSELRSNEESNRLDLFFYAATLSGWNLLKDAIQFWQQQGDREARVFIGTDHGLTEPEALLAISSMGVGVYIPTRYTGIYHPKVAVLHGASTRLIVGSNNLTRNGLRQNIEFGCFMRFEETPNDLVEWSRQIERASDPLTDAMLSEYQQERRQFSQQRVAAGTFVWSRKQQNANEDDARVVVVAGDLVLEIMPRETGADGKQIQLPLVAAESFFSILRETGSTQTILLRLEGDEEFYERKMTVYQNSTTRLVLRELDFRDRPCVLLFHHLGNRQYEYRIISQSTDPTSYAQLLTLCDQQTSEVARRWGIISDE